VPRDTLAFVAAGADHLHLSAGPAGARVLLVGGAPFGEQLVMWWNFVGRSHDDIVAARAAWQSEIDIMPAHSPVFGLPEHEPEPPLPAPPLPIAQLKPRD
jgi:hypothetical protein